jgi:hypothetical protein
VPYQDLENKIMLQGLLDEPRAFLDHIRRYTFSLSTQIIFGYRSPSVIDPNLQQLFWVRGHILSGNKFPGYHTLTLHITEFRALG